jgi:hypothetical protein
MNRNQMGFWYRGKGRKSQKIADRQTLNQRVHGSSPCAPTIEINRLRRNFKNHAKPADP